MGRLIVIAGIVLIVIWLLRRALSRPPTDAAGPAEGGELVSCARCDVNLPRAEARSAGGRFYCSEEHLKLGPRNG